MNVFKANEAKREEFSRFIGEYLELSENEISDLDYRITYSKYFVLKRKEKSKSNIAFRITFPVWFLCMFLLFVFAPLKWIFIGEWYYEPKGVIYRIMNN